MKLPLREPLFARYLYIGPDDILRVYMPVVSGTSIGLDNTCKAVYSLQEFFGKGTNSNKKTTLKNELMAYKEALESDLKLLDTDSQLGQEKQERLRQIDIHLEVLTHLERHRELNCLNQSFPSYPRPLEALMQDRASSNLYCMVLRPTSEDGYLRSEAANPIFSVAHKSVARGIVETVSPLQQALVKAYMPLSFKDLKSQVINQVLKKLKPLELPVDFGNLRKKLQETVKEQLQVEIDFTTYQGKPLTQEIIDNNLVFDAKTKHKEYLDTLWGYCANNLLDTMIPSPFNYLIDAESWSIATQFLLGITNIYAETQGKISPSTNFGQILDNHPDLSADLAQTLALAQQDNLNIDEACLCWINNHPKELALQNPFTQQDIEHIKKTFAGHYLAIKDSPHFDEFFVFDPNKKGHFVIHQGAVCTNFSKFVNSPLFHLPQELTQLLEKTRLDPDSPSTTIPHKNAFEQKEVDLDTKGMGNGALQALYEQINCYPDPKLKEQLLAQFKLERPDFKPRIDAKDFLQHVAYGEQDEAECFLKKEDALAQELLTARKIPFTDYSGRTFKCSAYEYAYWAKDTHMCRMLEKYMDAQTKHHIQKRIQKIEELVGDLLKKARGLAYTQNGNDHRSAHFDLTPLKQALKTYIEAYNQSPKNTRADWDALERLWIKFGIFQKDVPAHIAQEYCHPKRSFADVVNKPDDVLNASNNANLVRQFKFSNYINGTYDNWFMRGSSSNTGLGSTFAILRGGRVVGGFRQPVLRVLLTDLAAIETIEKVRTEDLKQSLVNLGPSIPQPYYHHRS